MKHQEIFEKVARHLFAQGGRAMVSINGGEICAYRGLNGTMCAAGCLIPDELYSPDLEGLVVEAMSDGVYDRLFPNINRLFLSDLQRVHDSSINWKSDSTMREALISVAKFWQLDHDFLAELSFSRN